jgi:hypothetical protein
MSRVRGATSQTLLLPLLLPRCRHQRPPHNDSANEHKTQTDEAPRTNDGSNRRKRAVPDERGTNTRPRCSLQNNAADNRPRPMATTRSTISLPMHAWPARSRSDSKSRSGCRRRLCWGIRPPPHCAPDPTRTRPRPSPRSPNHSTLSPNDQPRLRVSIEPTVPRGSTLRSLSRYRPPPQLPSPVHPPEPHPEQTTTTTDPSPTPVLGRTHPSPLPRVQVPEPTTGRSQLRYAQMHLPPGMKARLPCMVLPLFLPLPSMLPMVLVWPMVPIRCLEPARDHENRVSLRPSKNGHLEEASMVRRPLHTPQSHDAEPHPLVPRNRPCLHQVSPSQNPMIFFLLLTPFNRPTRKRRVSHYRQTTP